jgi:hypothetical protein
MAATALPVVDLVQQPEQLDGARREGAIRASVLATLGRPDHLFRVAVVPLWGGYLRVNVVTGDDPGSVRIPHSYFVAADGRGNIIESTPAIRREYPLSP